MSRLNGKIALIIGGTSGMGAPTGKLFQSEGATVVATGSTIKTVASSQQQIAGVEFTASDEGDADAAKALTDHVRAKHSRIDILFVNAGIAMVSRIDAVDEVAFDRLINLIFRGPYFLLKHAVPVMSDGGSIILTSSLAAVRGIAGLSAYGAGKAALRSLGSSLAVELAPRRIRVNTITPGPARTSLGAKMEMKPEQTAGVSEFTPKVPLGRTGEPDEIAAAALHFASEDSQFTTGAEITVDGGITASA